VTSARPAVASRRERGKDRQELIVRAAAQMIAERGLAQVRVADVAERAGISTGHVTYYFPTKSALLMAAIRDSEEQLIAEVERSVLRVRDPWRRLDRLVELSASSGPGDQGWVLWFQVWHEASLDPELAVVQDVLDRRWREVLADVLRYGAEREAFEVVDAEATARVLSAIVDGLSIQATLGAPGVAAGDVLALFREAARTLLTPHRADPHEGGAPCS
jgi:AcrR family transcriptional regulator